MKFTQITLHPIVHKLMVEMSLLDRPATPDEIVKIVQAVLAEAEGRKPEPLAPKLVVPEDPDEASAKQAMMTVHRPVALANLLNDVRGCNCWLTRRYTRPLLRIVASFTSQEQIRAVLTEVGIICPILPKCPSRWKGQTRRTFGINVRLPEDWRMPLPPWTRRSQ